MTDAEILEWVNGFFQTHIDADYWSGLDQGQQAACVKTATLDILARVPWLSTDDLEDYASALYAIAEQAVWLSRNYSEQTGGKVITSESVEGLSVGYTLVGGSSRWGIGIAQRAEAYLDQLRKSRKINLRFSRG